MFVFTHTTHVLNNKKSVFNHMTFMFNHITFMFNHITLMFNHITIMFNHITFMFNHITFKTGTSAQVSIRMYDMYIGRFNVLVNNTKSNNKNNTIIYNVCLEFPKEVLN